MDRKLPFWWNSRDSGRYHRPTKPREHEEEERLFKTSIFETDAFENHTNHYDDDDEADYAENVESEFASRFSATGHDTSSKEILYDLLRTLDVKDAEIKRLAYALSEKERLISDLENLLENSNSQSQKLREIVKSFTDTERVDPSVILEFQDERKRERWEREERRYIEEVCRLQRHIEHLQERIREHARRNLERNESIHDGYTASNGTDIVPHFFLSKNAPKELFDAVFKSLSKQYHPDKKHGDPEKMKEINEVKIKFYTEKGWS
jgi:hypothetical protein